MEERLLLDGIALQSSNVPERDVEFAAAIEANFADSALTFGDGTAMSAGEAANAIALDGLAERRITFADASIEDVAERRHVLSLLLRCQFSVLRACFLAFHPCDVVFWNHQVRNFWSSRSLSNLGLEAKYSFFGV